MYVADLNPQKGGFQSLKTCHSWVQTKTRTFKTGNKKGFEQTNLGVWECSFLHNNSVTNSLDSFWEKTQGELIESFLLSPLATRAEAFKKRQISKNSEVASSKFRLSIWGKNGVRAGSSYLQGQYFISCPQDVIKLPWSTLKRSFFEALQLDIHAQWTFENTAKASQKRGIDFYKWITNSLN